MKKKQNLNRNSSDLKWVRPQQNLNKNLSDLKQNKHQNLNKIKLFICEITRATFRHSDNQNRLLLYCGIDVFMCCDYRCALTKQKTLRTGLSILEHWQLRWDAGARHSILEHWQLAWDALDTALSSIDSCAEGHLSVVWSVDTGSCSSSFNTFQCKERLVQ